MLEHVEPTTQTVGSLRESKAMFNGQAETREYSDAERAELIGGTRPKAFGMDWMDKPGAKVDSMLSTGTKEEGE